MFNFGWWLWPISRYVERYGKENWYLSLSFLKELTNRFTGEFKRILLVDAPAALGWEVWRKIDQENSMNVLHGHIDDLNTKGYLREYVDTMLMTYSISGALNELALNYLQNGRANCDDKVIVTITQLVSGFKKT